ncbi:MAG: hypothetical protein BGO78_10165 [Chloroflexi bacterium 44-23]|nr:MAG: hypothetical protein BGO78_10165 [Chloroflexi bacterium 44-23]
MPSSETECVFVSHLAGLAAHVIGMQCCLMKLYFTIEEQRVAGGGILIIAADIRKKLGLGRLETPPKGSYATRSAIS